MSERRIIRHLVNRRAGFDDTAISSAPPFTAFLPPTSPAKQAESGTLWSPTSLSAGSRRPSLRGKGSVRGSVVDHESNREIVFESILERGMAEMLLARRDVSRIWDQPPPVRYLDADGRGHQHTFDFLAITSSGRRCAIAVKPAAKVVRSQIEETISLIKAQVGDRFADTYLLRTERHITKARVFNARLILRSRRTRSEEDIATVRAIVGKLPGALLVSDIVAASKIGARGFNALVGLVDDGAVQPVGEVRLDYSSHVRITASV